MKPLLPATAAAALLLAGCTTPAYTSPVEVTRFVGQAPAELGRGAITVRGGLGDSGSPPERPAVEAAVAAQLGRLGYTVVGGSAGQVAEVWVERSVQRTAAGRRSPVSVGVGGSTGSYGSGVGVGLGINLGGGGRPSETIHSELRVVIRPAAGGTALWEGRARFAASPNSAYATAAASADRLAQALFAGFPGRSGETIEVE